MKAVFSDKGNRLNGNFRDMERRIDDIEDVSAIRNGDQQLAADGFSWSKWSIVG